jgi:hypothetical protein
MLRSLLFVPGDNEKKLLKGADTARRLLARHAGAR